VDNAPTRNTSRLEQAPDTNEFFITILSSRVNVQSHAWKIIHAPDFPLDGKAENQISKNGIIAFAQVYALNTRAPFAR
jgi:hypothetical protein